MTAHSLEHVIVIGGGVGGAIAHDLCLRGFKTTLLEKGELVSATTGRHHGLLHSGARYVLHDLKAARECIAENRILRRIAPDALEQNDGLFIALDDEDMACKNDFADRCGEADIPALPIEISTALKLEPHLNPGLKAAFRVPDATMDAWRLPMHFFATAKANGADIRAYSEVTGIISNGKCATGVRVFDHRTHQTYSLGADIIINATGPWSARTASMLGIEIPVRPVPGVMASVAPRLTQMVVNRLHLADEGDIIVPQRQMSLLGTTAWLAENPDDITIPPDHVNQIVKLCARLVPQVAKSPVQAVWMASRPVIVEDRQADPTQMSRTFAAIDHAENNGIEGFVSIFGGKATTMRAMAEEAVDLVCAKTGHNVACNTRNTRLLHYRAYFRQRSEPSFVSPCKLCRTES